MIKKTRDEVGEDILSVPHGVVVEDEPSFRHRGVLVDTARYGPYHVINTHGIFHSEPEPEL